MSDGQYTPAETVRYAGSKGASCISITDHDRISGLREAEITASEVGIEFIPGIEISTRGNRELHILGYYIDYTRQGLIDACDGFIRIREQRAPRIFAYLRQKGVPLDEKHVQSLAQSYVQSHVQSHAPQIAPGRPHFARAMVEAGYVGSVQEAFDKYLGTPEFDAVERVKPSAKDGIKMILDAGGVPVLAHPAQLKLADEELEKLIESLISDGLCGIECYYSTHSPKQIRQYLEYAKRYGLIVTCGSDFHGGSNKPGIDIGVRPGFVSETESEEILHQLRIRRQSRRKYCID